MKIIEGLKHKHEELKELLEITKKASIQFDKLIKNGKLKNKISIISSKSPGISSPLAVHLEHEKVNVTIVCIPEVNTDITNNELDEKKAKKYLPINEKLRVEKTVNNGYTDILIDNVTEKFPIDEDNQSDPDLVNNLANELNPLAVTKSINITQRQRQVIELIGNGSTNKEIAQNLHLSTHTVKSHVHNILVKLSLNTRVQIAKYAHLSKYYKIAM